MNRPAARAWWIGVPLGLLLLVLLLLLLIDLFDRRLIFAPIASLVEEQTGRALRMRNADLRWGWPMSLHADKVSLANADWASEGPLAQADTVSTPVDLFEVLDGPPYADLRLQDLEVLVERRDDGEWNWMMDTGPPESEEAPRLPVTFAAEGGRIVYEKEDPLAIQLRHLSLKSDSGATRQRVLKLRASRAGTPVAIDSRFAAAEERWEGTAALRAGESVLESRFRVDTGEGPLRIRAHVDSGLLAPAQLAELAPGQQRGSLSLPRLEGIDAEIAIRVATLRLPDVDIDDIETQLSIRDGHARLNDLVAHIGSARVHGGVSVDTTAEDPVIRIAADLARAPLSSLPDSLPLSGQAGEVAAQLDARVQMPGRQLPPTPVALLSQLAVPESRFVYARETGDERAVLIARLEVQPAGGEPSVDLFLEGVETPPFDATLSAPPLAALANRESYPVQLTVSTEGAHARIEAQLDEILQQQGFELAFSISGNQLPEVPALGFAPPPMPEFSLSGELERQSGPWAVPAFELSYGPTRLSGSAFFEREAERPDIALDVQAPLLDLSMIPEDPAGATADGTADKAAGWLPGDVVDRLRAVDADLELSADRVRMTNEYSLDSVELAARLQQGRLRADPVSFAVAGGSVQGSLSMHALDPVEGQLSLDIEDLQPAQLKGALAPLQERLGRVSGELRVAFAEASPERRPDDGALASLAQFSVHNSRLRFRKADAHTDLTLRLESGDASAPGGEQGMSLHAEGRYRNNPLRLELEGEPLLELRYPGSPYELRTQLEFADSDLRGDVSLDLSAATPAVTATLHSDELELDDVTALINGRGKEEAGRVAETDAKEGDVLPQQPFNFDFLHRANVDIEYTASDVDASGVPFDSVAANVRLQDGRLLVEPVRMQTAEGTATLHADLQTRDSRLEGVLDVEARGMELSEILSKIDIASDSFGTVGGQGKFWVSGDSLASVVGSADGGLMVLMTGGQLDALLVELAGLDIGEAALAASGLYEPASIDCAFASLHSTDGILDVDRFVVDTEDTVFFLNGTVNLGEETIDLALFSEAKDPSFPTTDSPLALTGSLRQPEVNLMSGELSARALGAAALAALAGPVAAALPFIEPGLEDEPNVCKGWVEKLRSER